MCIRDSVYTVIIAFSKVLQPLCFMQQTTFIIKRSQSFTGKIIPLQTKLD